MFFRSTIIASAAVALLATMSVSPVEGHSWADCVDWRFNTPGKEDWTDNGGKCFGYARKYPINSGFKFGDLDSASPGRHYQQNPSDFVPCSDGVHGKEVGSDETRQDPVSKAYGGKYGNMATVKAGDQMCIRWPAKNHATPTEKDRGVYINMPETPTLKDPTQDEFMRMNITKLPYKNCNFMSDTDHTPCGGCFTVPANRQPGIYVVQWRWELNPNEWYTSCWDLAITAADGASTNGTGPGNNSSVVPLGGSTSLFAQLAEE
ncbi:hypothetical protein BGW41_000180 [Actinomortierella wolfii]|nr:hypothetical protein BGW41_000180 [Actinomortierella wolfii]